MNNRFGSNWHCLTRISYACVSSVTDEGCSECRRSIVWRDLVWLFTDSGVAIFVSVQEGADAQTTKQTLATSALVFPFGAIITVAVCRIALWDGGQSNPHVQLAILLQGERNGITFIMPA